MLRHSFAFALHVATERTKNALKNVSTPGNEKPALHNNTRSSYPRQFLRCRCKCITR